MMANTETGYKVEDDLKFEIVDYEREVNMHLPFYAIGEVKAPFSSNYDGFLGLATSNGD